MSAVRTPKKPVVDDKSIAESSERYAVAVKIIRRFTRYDHQLKQLESDYRVETEIAARRFSDAREKVLAKISGQITPLIDLCAERTRDTKQKYLDVSGGRLKFTKRARKIKILDTAKLIDAGITLDEETMQPIIREELRGIVQEYQPPTPAMITIVNVKAIEHMLWELGEALPESIQAYVQEIPEHQDFGIQLMDGGDYLKEALKKMRTADGTFIITDAAGDLIEGEDDD